MSNPSTPSLPSTRHSLPTKESFIKAFSDTDPVGPSLRYESAYDTIRLSRQEDDPRLSMGVWETDLKKADWVTVEDLCIDILTTKSKDLQIALWLTEAWTAKDGFEGYIRGVEIITDLCSTYWDTIHPQIQGDDVESRSLLFEWMDTALSNRLLLVPITRSSYNETSFGIGYYKSVIHLEAIQKRPQSGKPSPTVDPSKMLGTLEEFEKSLDQTPDAYLEAIIMNVRTATQTTQSLKELLNPLLGSTSPAFSLILPLLQEIDRLLKGKIQKRQPKTEPELSTLSTEGSPGEPKAESDQAPTGNEAPQLRSSLNSPSDAYRQLEIVASFLEQNDPQNLASKVLRKLISWENKNIIDVLKQIAKTPQEYEMLMRLLGDGS